MGGFAGIGMISDGDGILDGAEVYGSLYPGEIADVSWQGLGFPYGLTDEDVPWPLVGIPTDPNDPDTDDDGCTDGDELLVHFTDQLDPNDHP